MTTGNEYANITQKKLLGYRDLNDRMLSYLTNSLKENFSYVWGTNVVLGSQIVIEADGSDAFKITGTSVATDGIGNLLKISDSLVNDGISFENTTSVNYYVGLKYAKIPNEIDINPRTGLPEYRSWIEEIGEEGTPDSVTDNGNGTITFVVDGVTESGVTNAGRQVLVYKIITDKNATTASVAIEICTVAWSGTNNTITTTAAFGQSTVSTVNTDYQVVLLGPTVKRYTDLRSESNYVFIGIIEGNGGTPTVFNMDDQNITTITMDDFADLEKEMHLLAYMGPRVSSPEIDSDYDAVHRNAWYAPYNYGGVGSTNSLEISTDYRPTCCCAAIISGRLKNMWGSRLSHDIKIVDDETLDIDTVDLSSYFPATNTYWYIFSMCKDGDKLYVLGVGNTTFSMVLHCFDIGTWVPSSGWTTGTVVTTLSGLEVTGACVINANDDYVAVSRPDQTIEEGTDLAVSIYSKSNGTLLGSGAGDCPTNTSETGYVKWIASNGTYIFFHIDWPAMGTPEAWLCSMEITNPGANGIGGANWPIQTDYCASGGSEGYGDVVAFGDLVFVTARDGTSLGTLASVSSGRIATVAMSSAATCYQLNRAVFDGNRIWALGGRLLGSSYRTTLFRIDVRNLCNEATGSANFHSYNGDNTTLKGNSYEHDTDDHFNSSLGIQSRTPLLFNGKDIWISGNDYLSTGSGQRLGGYIYRVPRIFNL